MIVVSGPHFGKLRHDLESGALDGVSGDVGQRIDEMWAEPLDNGLLPGVFLEATDRIPLLAHETRSAQLTGVHVVHHPVDDCGIERGVHQVAGLCFSFHLKFDDEKMKSEGVTVWRGTEEKTVKCLTANEGWFSQMTVRGFCWQWRTEASCRQWK